MRDLFDQEFAEEYFSANNFLSKKILEDISYVRDSYEDAWEVVEQEERDQVWLKLLELIVNEVFNLTKLSLLEISLGFVHCFNVSPICKYYMANNLLHNFL